jgi:hypothetical protein
MQQDRNPIAALEYEVGQEKASALGRLGRKLEAALAALRAFDEAHGRQAHRVESESLQRLRLLAEAGEAFWYLMVQRDACGLRNNAVVLADYGVPREVANRMGPAAAVHVAGQSKSFR